jgi:hypothetical protein
VHGLGLGTSGARGTGNWFEHSGSVSESFFLSFVNKRRENASYIHNIADNSTLIGAKYC